MSNNKSIIDTNPALADMSIEEIQELLNEKQAQAKEQAKQRREEYEGARTNLIEELGGFALNLHQQMSDLKYQAFKDLTLFRQRMLEYGDLRRGEANKGNFELKNENYKIIFTSQVNKKFDERAELAEAKLKQFLGSFVKKNKEKSYKLIMALLERNATGDFDFDLINRLYKMRDDFDNPLWREALDMFMESYSPYGTAQYVRFFVKDTTNNSWKPVVLDIAKLGLPAAAPKPEEVEA